METLGRSFLLQSRSLVFCFRSKKRRVGCCSFSLHTHANKKKLVFLGSPSVAAQVLDKLLDASQSKDSLFEVSAVVTQPPSAQSRGKRIKSSPVAECALKRRFSEDLIFTPEKAGEESFLTELRALKPDLCVTAAYGNILPQRFLEIPQNGTVNIHPSLLPLYRGAAPVQRALQDGVSITGVSVAFTVRKLDAGPIIAKEEFKVNDSIKAPELLEILFEQGTDALLRELPSIFSGCAAANAQEQDDSLASHAPKVRSDESWLSFDEPAFVLHNKVRAFAGWPGTRTKIQTYNPQGQKKVIEIKVVTTRVGSNEFVSNDNDNDNDENYIQFHNDALVFCCGGNTTLEVLELQIPGKKVVHAREFWNGLCGRKPMKA